MYDFSGDLLVRANDLDKAIEKSGHLNALISVMFNGLDVAEPNKIDVLSLLLVCKQLSDENHERLSGLRYVHCNDLRDISDDDVNNKCDLYEHRIHNVISDLLTNIETIHADQQPLDDSFLDFANAELHEITTAAVALRNLAKITKAKK